MTIRRLDLLDAEYIAHSLAVELMNSASEPIPPFNTTDFKKLESSLNEPFQTFSGKHLHRTFAERAAVLFYLITKNHCFSNGNKRMAVTLTAVFCYVNKRWLNIAPLELYNIANIVAESKVDDRENIHKILVAIFRNHISSLESAAEKTPKGSYSAETKSK